MRDAVAASAGILLHGAPAAVLSSGAMAGAGARAGRGGRARSSLEGLIHKPRGTDNLVEEGESIGLLDCRFHAPPMGRCVMRALRRLVSACLGVWLFAAGAGWAEPGAEVVVDVDSAKREMRVLRGDKVLAVFEPVSVGRWGVSEQKRRGDGKTPLGTYRITWVKSEGHFGPFLGFNYPSLTRAEKGLAAGEISQAEFDAIQKANAEGRIPPQNTKLGGYIGIHGLGRGDPEIHRDLNWTKGCIAVTNEQMGEIVRLVGKGALVRIR